MNLTWKDLSVIRPHLNRTFLTFLLTADILLALQSKTQFMPPWLCFHLWRSPLNQRRPAVNRSLHPAAAQAGWHQCLGTPQTPLSHLNHSYLVFLSFSDKFCSDEKDEMSSFNFSHEFIIFWRHKSGTWNESHLGFLTFFIANKPDLQKKDP